MAIATRGQIVSNGELPFAAGNQRAIWADVVLRGDTIRAIGVHLESMAFKDGDFERFSQPKLHRILSRYARFNRIRTQQIMSLLAFMARSPYRVVLAGDFNDPPHSYNCWKLSGRLSASDHYAVEAVMEVEKVR